MYSTADGRFLPDRYIEGTCPNCGYDSARGDQCENCTKQLDPTDLINPRSTISGSTDLEMRETKHLYLRQSAMRDQLEAWIDTQDRLADPDHLHRQEMAQRRRRAAGPRHHPRPRLGRAGAEGRRALAGDGGQGLLRLVRRARSNTSPARRNGPRPGKGDDWERWWRTDKGADDVRYTQFMGKDNVPFHTLSFPATILGSGEPWKLVDYIKSFNYLNYDGGQFSHLARARRVHGPGAGDPAGRLLALVAAVAMRPKARTREFTWENFQTSVNKDLADVLGNFVSRVTKFCRSKFGEAVPEGGA